MAHTISSLAYKGSTVEAIAEAKRQKKLFVVYISGDNAESTQLEESIWIDSSVAESILKYCILLHISEGSTDATNFSAIYPQKSAPCITAIGYNGVKVWQNEGFVSADILASSLEKAWLSLHIQETTATFLTAALASKKSEPHGTQCSETVSFEDGSSSSMDVPSPPTDKQGQYSDSRAVVCSEMESKGSDHANEEINSKLGDEASPGSVFTNVLEGGEVEQSTSSVETTKESLRFVKLDPSTGGDLNVVDHHSEVAIETSEVTANEATEVVQEKNSEAVEDNKIDSEVTTETSQVVANKATEAVQDKKADVVDKDEIHVLESCSSKPTDVHLNIRLLDGANLQEKFLLTSTLRMVKDYVDGNQASAIGSYDLAIPYPRKVFTDQDLNETLAELGLVGRQALIIVPRHQATGYYRGGSSSRNQTKPTADLASSNGNNEGYLGLTKRILSYLNPFSYLGGGANSSNSAQESQGRVLQYGPNPALQNNLGGTGTTPSVYSSNQSNPVTGRDNNSTKKAPTSRLGSNIHTLKHDEDDGRFSDRNAFWNGNSTEYGGDNDGK
ncbi:plant UBX domain-containing protein 11-like isoform X1 [Actinidia eriantha]|uniref:plant UBX domain-containing protein 11-like isoform X1 n=1 Tax=Actinidia eriantha TaxID=165200 RepID=UPI002589C8DC|nr:plant UBX domain-containing protein 11-like isoform X1 [Actinidia eriantha]XP_057471652.1 plant UBX domain-containing protein 11-like isoform X1 [Actinidia eriantha]XP_057471653.1 plant UBX domain-containing protein 11-like isoform X1 [Actinidia eriantha]